MLFRALEVYFSRNPEAEIKKMGDELGVMPNVTQSSHNFYLATYDHLEIQKALRVAEKVSSLEGLIAIKMIK